MFLALLAILALTCLAYTNRRHHRQSADRLHQYVWSDAQAREPRSLVVDDDDDQQVCVCVCVCDNQFIN